MGGRSSKLSSSSQLDAVAVAKVDNQTQPPEKINQQRAPEPTPEVLTAQRNQNQGRSRLQSRGRSSSGSAIASNDPDSDTDSELELEFGTSSQAVVSLEGKEGVTVTNTPKTRSHSKNKNVVQTPEIIQNQNADATTSNSRTGGMGMRRRYQSQSPDEETPKSGAPPRRWKRARLDQTPQKKDNPLVFTLSPDLITMSTLIGNNSLNLYHPQRGFSAIIGISENSSLIIGTDALTCGQHYSLQDILLLEDGVKISFKINGREVTQSLDLPFFLGLILRQMKEFAEEGEYQFKREFNRAVVIIPIWMSSPLKGDIKDAGRIAGFGEVNLINRESLAAYDYFSKKNQSNENVEDVILILSELFGVVSAVLYQSQSQSDLEGRKLIMVDDHHRHPQEPCNSKTKKKTVTELCSSLTPNKWWQYNKIGIGQNLKQKKVIMLTLTESHEWRKAFIKVAFKMKWECGGDGVDNYSEELMPLAIAVDEYQPIRLRPVRDAFVGGSFTQMVYDGHCKTILPKCIDNHEMRMGLFQIKKKVRFFQENVLKEEKVLLGELELKLEKKGNKDDGIIPIFQVDKEAVVSLEGVKMRKKVGKDEMLKEGEDYQWNYGGLIEEEREEMGRLVEEIMKGEKVKEPDQGPEEDDSDDDDGGKEGGGGGGCVIV